ncbi:putative nucleolar protein 10/Enp2 [Helianthus anomalus]
MERVDLIQDLRFETATTRIKATPMANFSLLQLRVLGIYPPQVKVYELRELPLKFERHLISDIINFQVSSDDYSKLAFLCADRSVNLHAIYGSHYSLRVPRFLTVGWLYGPTIEDMLTGLNIHGRGWKSVLCSPYPRIMLFRF